MNIDKEALAQNIVDHVEDIVDALVESATAVAIHGRNASVALHIKIAHDKDNENKLNFLVQRKNKRPKNRNQDLTAWTDEDLLSSYDIVEAPGQQRIGDE